MSRSAPLRRVEPKAMRSPWYDQGPRLFCERPPGGGTGRGPAAALVLGEDDVVGRAPRPARAAHALGKEGELASRTERGAHLVELRRVAETRRDQHLALRRVPRRQGPGAGPRKAAH